MNPIDCDKTDEFITSPYVYKNLTKVHPINNKKSDNEIKDIAYNNFLTAQINLIKASKEYTKTLEVVVKLKKK